ncbi:MAG: hypothetical protein EOP84_12985 [Verrucomicrobiaceae bacterium]|nr:MAG: hypothetical protein EOP84_12985 [Verrucomicrobiaceae bacterium]
MRTFLVTALAVCTATVALAQNPAGTESPQPKEEATGTGLPAAAKWLLGEWVFDAEYTQKKQAGAKKEGDLSDLAGALVNPQLVAQLKGAKLKITESEVIFTTASGNGSTEKYSFMESPDQNTVSLKEGEGKITAYHREGDYVWINSTGTAPTPFYFRRVK